MKTERIVPDDYEAIERCARIVEYRILRMKSILANKTHYSVLNHSSSLKNLSSNLTTFDITNINPKHKAYWMIKGYAHSKLTDPEDFKDFFANPKVTHLITSIKRKKDMEEIKKIIDARAENIKYAERKIRTIKKVNIFNRTQERPQTQIKTKRLNTIRPRTVTLSQSKAPSRESFRRLMQRCALLKQSRNKGSITRLLKTIKPKTGRHAMCNLLKRNFT